MASYVWLYDVQIKRYAALPRPVIDPIAEIIHARGQARDARDPLTDVCYLVTVASADRAEARALTLRDITARGLGVLINRTSPKWEQLSRTGTATMLIHWPSVRRQYRIWGAIAPIEPERVDGYWRRKSHGSKLLEQYYTAYAPQSAPVASREEFLAGIDALRRRYPDRDTVPPPESMAGIYVVPREIEAWHGSEERLHDRRLFRRTGAEWSWTTIIP